MFFDLSGLYSLRIHGVCIHTKKRKPLVCDKRLLFVFFEVAPINEKGHLRITVQNSALFASCPKSFMKKMRGVDKFSKIKM